MKEYMKLFTDEQRLELVKLLKENIVLITKAIENLELENDIFAGVHIASFKINNTLLGAIMVEALDSIDSKYSKLEKNKEETI